MIFPMKECKLKCKSICFLAPQNYFCRINNGSLFKNSISNITLENGISFDETVNKKDVEKKKE